MPTAEFHPLANGRSLTVFPRTEYERLQQARLRQKSNEFNETYKMRAGIEGTISQAVNRFGIRQARYRGLAKTHLQHLATATAINLNRIVDWLNGHRPPATPIPPFNRLVDNLS